MATPAQKLYMANIMDPKIALLIVTGPAGSGKTMIASRYAAQQTLSGRYDKLVITRPTVSCDSEKHGFIPGTLDDKMKPWVRPITDHLVQKNRKVEICPLAFMRGLTFDKSFVIADEMQNSTKEQMKMLLTRMGRESKLVITGDPTQTDIKANGFTDLISRIHKNESDFVKLVELSEDDVMRSELVKYILRIYA